MRRIHPFAVGYVGAALLLGLAAGARVDTTALWMFPAGMGAGAAVATLIGWWWPGLNGRGWKLYLVAFAANPVTLGALFLVVDSYNCLLHQVGGWSCILAWLGPDILLGCLPLPLVGLLTRWLVRRRSRAPAGSG